MKHPLKTTYKIITGDSRQMNLLPDSSVYYGRYKVIPIRTEIIKFCETISFDYMGAVIWQKVTTCNTTGGASVKETANESRDEL